MLTVYHKSVLHSRLKSICTNLQLPYNTIFNTWFLLRNRMAKKLYVGNLNPDANGVSLKALFSMFGTAEKAYVIPDSETGKCKDF